MDGIRSTTSLHRINHQFYLVRPINLTVVFVSVIAFSEARLLTLPHSYQATFIIKTIKIFIKRAVKYSDNPSQDHIESQSSSKWQDDNKREDRLFQIFLGRDLEV